MQVLPRDYEVIDPVFAGYVCHVLLFGEAAKGEDENVREWEFNFEVGLNLEAMLRYMEQHKPFYFPRIEDGRRGRVLTGYHQLEKILFEVDPAGFLTCWVKNDTDFNTKCNSEPVRKFRAVCRNLGPQVQVDYCAKTTCPHVLCRRQRNWLKELKHAGMTPSMFVDVFNSLPEHPGLPDDDDEEEYQASLAYD